MEERRAKLPVTVIPGIAKKSSEKLSTCGIYTVADLAESSFGKLVHLNISGLSNCISSAKNMLGGLPTSKEHVEKVIQHEKQEPKDDEESDKVPHLLIDTHPWMDQPISIPFRGIMYDGNVHELIIDPTHRVAMLCCFQKEGENIMPMLSPITIAHFNPNLPYMTGVLNRDDIVEMKLCYKSIRCTLKETNMILESQRS